MTAQERFKGIQRAMGMDLDDQDGLPGKYSMAAYNKAAQDVLIEKAGGTKLYGDIGNFGMTIEDEDLWIRNVRCTCFGGSNDSGDSGATASGYPTKGHPSLKAASLPMNYAGSHKPTYRALHGSIIPMMPFGVTSRGEDNPKGAHVEVFFKNGKSIICPVIDLGPNIRKYPDNALDLTIAAARVCNPKATANNFETILSYRIIGGTRFLHR